VNTLLADKRPQTGFKEKQDSQACTHAHAANKRKWCSDLWQSQCWQFGLSAWI